MDANIFQVVMMNSAYFIFHLKHMIYRYVIPKLLQAKQGEKMSQSYFNKNMF